MGGGGGGEAEPDQEAAAAVLLDTPRPAALPGAGRPAGAARCRTAALHCVLHAALCFVPHPSPDRVSPPASLAGVETDSLLEAGYSLPSPTGYCSILSAVVSTVYCTVYSLRYTGPGQFAWDAVSCATGYNVTLSDFGGEVKYHKILHQRTK